MCTPDQRVRYMLRPDARLDVIHLRTMTSRAGLVVTCERKVLLREKCIIKPLEVGSVLLLYLNKHITQ